MCVLVAVLAGGFLLLFVLRRLQHVHAGLAIGAALTTAYLVRIMAALALNQITAAAELRGGDELTFISRAQLLADGQLASGNMADTFLHSFQTFFFTWNYRLFDQPPQMMLRAEVVALSVTGIALLAAAVYELAGRRAAVIAAWVLAFEPSNVFFSGILHKEPFMLLAEGLVVYGGARLWKRGHFIALVPMIAGCLLATVTRPYVGWFLAATAAVVALHAGLRRNSASSSFALAAVCVALIVAFFPTVLNASSPEKLKNLQISQDANAADTNSNLSLERVDYSTRGKVIVNLPKRVFDILTRPYPWEVANTSQQLGAFGTTFLWGALVLLVMGIARAGRTIMRRAGPLVYPLVFLLMAYALSAGNAGTAFRYRTHIVAVLVSLVIVLRRRRSEEDAPVLDADESGRFSPVLARGSVPTLAR